MNVLLTNDVHEARSPQPITDNALDLNKHEHDVASAQLSQGLGQQVRGRHVQVARGAQVEREGAHARMSLDLAQDLLRGLLRVEEVQRRVDAQEKGIGELTRVRMPAHVAVRSQAGQPAKSDDVWPARAIQERGQ